jgi:hypothetical protein
MLVTVLWIGFGVGLALNATVAAVVVYSLVLPRAQSGPQRMSIAINRAIRWLFVSVAARRRTYEKVDGMLAPIGPVAVLAQLVVWLFSFWVGYALMQWPFTRSLGEALPTAAASLVTVGIAHSAASANSLVTVLAAGTGAVVVALQIAYLPAIYSAYNRREALVTLLESRAGLPAWGPELLIRHRLVGITDTLPELYDDWEQWSAELSESHTSYPVLLLFRSPDPWYSWVLAMLAVLDGAAMHLALAPDTAPSQARLCLRMGFTALQRISVTLRWTYDPDPLPDAAIHLTYDEFAAAVALLESVGFETQRSAEEAWPHFRGWRVNYEDLAYRLADRVVAPPAPWSGPRRWLHSGVVPPARPPHRTPDGREYDDPMPLRPSPTIGSDAEPSARRRRSR